MKTYELWQTWSQHRAFRPVLAAVAVILILLMVKACTGDEDTDTEAVFEVRRGPLTISVTESGAIKAREQAIIKSQVEGETSVLYVIPEGTRVTNGTLLVELDVSNLADMKINQQIQVENAQAAFISAQEGLEVVKNQAQSDVDKAELDFDFAKLDLRKYTEGESLRDLHQAKAQIALAESDQERAAEQLKWSKILYEAEYLAESEMRADDLAHERAKFDLDGARENLRVLEEYTHERTLTELKSNVKQTEMALERTTRKASADVVQAQASLRAKESEFNRQETKLDKLIDQISKTKVYAPADGLVVYASSAKSGRRGNEEPLEEGSMVREREELIYLPTAFEYMAEVKVHESALQSIRVGLPATVKADAVPDKVFSGKVERIAPLPDASSMFWNPDLKIYPSEIHLDEESTELRTGMNCEVEIFIAHYPDAVFVPVQAVLQIGGVPTVYVARRGRFVPREVELGYDNNRMVRVISGLEAGDRVWLTPPLEAATIGEDAETPEGLPGEMEPAAPAPGRDPSSGEEAGDRGAGGRREMTDEQREAMRARREGGGGGDPGGGRGQGGGRGPGGGGGGQP